MSLKNGSFRFGEFVLNLEERVLTNGGEPVPLPPKAISLLSALVENYGRIIEKEELIQRVWADSIVEDGNLAFTIRLLRKSLNDDAQDPKFIETIHRRGYRFVASVEPVVREDALINAHNLSPGRLLPRQGLVISAVGLMLILAFGSFYFFQQVNAFGPPPARIHSLAILPLKNLTGDAANDYLSDGITEGLIAALSRMEGVKVIASGSALAYKDKEIDLSEVGKALNVESCLIGSVQKENDALRVNVRFVKVADGQILWAKEIYKPTNEIFALQDEIARDLAVGLNPEVHAETERDIAGHQTENVEAYELYLKGRFFWHQQTEEGFIKSIDHFNQAIAKDPNYSLAYSGLSDAYSSLGFYFHRPNEAMPKAGYYATRALELDEKSANAHASLGTVKYSYELDFAGAEREFQRALALEPNNSTAHDDYGNYLMAVGRADQAIAELKRAVELDPLAHTASCDLGSQYYHMRQYEKAIEQSQQNLEMAESCPYDRLWIGQSLGQKREYQRAIAELNKIQNYSKDWSPGLAEQGYAYAMSGQRARADEILRMLAKTSQQRFVDPYGIAIVNLGLGRTAETFAWLEKVYLERSPNLPFMRVDPKFDRLQDDARFQALIRRINFPT